MAAEYPKKSVDGPWSGAGAPRSKSTKTPSPWSGKRGHDAVELFTLQHDHAAPRDCLGARAPRASKACLRPSLGSLGAIAGHALAQPSLLPITSARVPVLPGAHRFHSPGVALRGPQLTGILLIDRLRRQSTWQATT